MRKLYVLVLVVLAACSSPKKEMTTKVDKLEAELQTKFDHKKAGELIASYDLYIQKYPQDSTSRVYMAKATEMSILDNQPEEALRFINLFLKTYPADPKAGLMQFKKAMVYDLLLHDGLRAVAEYNTFIKNFPQDPMRKEAENAILLIQNPEAFMDTYGEQGDSLTKGAESQ